MHLLLLVFFAALACPIVFGTLSHQGAFDASALSDVLISQCQFQSLALTANSTLPVGAITGALDIVLVNTTNAPGTQTTRTAAQMYADLTAALGIPPPANFTFFLTIEHAGTGTLTLAGGTGVTISNPTGGATTIATVSARDYIVQVVNPSTINIVAIGSRTNT
ncbi:MAG TPA: hypothetical protein VMQ17_08730 [Candidatus Sulfotelmatobacter sp.]|nr:hypothetical protein [Candidatus Sulfotelmatobacter sp.]